MCINGEMITYYMQLHDHNQDDNLNLRKASILHSDKAMITYYKNTVGLNKTCLYNSLIADYFRFIITRWRLSNHKLKIETLRYGAENIKIPRHMRYCALCNVLEDETHAVFIYA